MQYIWSLALTFLVEFLVIYFLVQKAPLKLLFYSFVINLFTLPIATNVYWNFLDNFWLVEFGVFTAEILLLWLLLNVGWKKAILISFCANFVTAMISWLFFVA